MTAILIALFVASQHPTHKNCAALRDQLVKATIFDLNHSNDHDKIHVDEDLTAIKEFATKTCRDGVERK